jgi:hypothetical protein
MSLLSIVLAGMLLPCGKTAHSAMTGADFLQAPPTYQEAFVNGFVRGMYSACLDHLETRKEVCSLAPVLDVTFEMTASQVLDIFLSFIRKNPSRHQKEASELLLDSLKETAAKPALPK